MLCLAIGFASCSHYNNREIASTMKEMKVVDEDGSFLLKDSSDEIYLRNTDARFDLKIENNTLVIELKKMKQKFSIAKFEGEQSNSIDSVQVNILKNKEEKKFKATLCTHGGCLPYPHFESTYKQLLEIQTLEGQVICYNNNVIAEKELYSVGACK